MSLRSISDLLAEWVDHTGDSFAEATPIDEIDLFDWDAWIESHEQEAS